MATRLTKEARREQLLQAAAGLVAERGAGALTMEGIAARAGVNKALPYRHFDNADSVLVALQEQVNQVIAERVVAALTGAGPGDRDRIDAVVGAFLDAVADQSTMLALLAAAAPTVDDGEAEAERIGNRFVAELLVRGFGVPRRNAPLAAEVLLGIVIAAARSWAHGDARRPAVQTTAVSACLAVIDAARP